MCTTTDRTTGESMRTITAVCTHCGNIIENLAEIPARWEHKLSERVLCDTDNLSDMRVGTPRGNFSPESILERMNQ